MDKNKRPPRLSPGEGGLTRTPNTLAHVLTATLMVWWIAQEDTGRVETKSKDNQLFLMYFFTLVFDLI